MRVIDLFETQIGQGIVGKPNVLFSILLVCTGLQSLVISDVGYFCCSPAGYIYRLELSIYTNFTLNVRIPPVMLKSTLLHRKDR